MIGSKEYDSQGPVGPTYETWSANAIFWTVTQSYAGLSDLVLRYG
jgi:sterol 3beta-glucosyltransferase